MMWNQCAFDWCVLLTFCKIEFMILEMTHEKRFKCMEKLCHLKACDFSFLEFTTSNVEVDQNIFSGCFLFTFLNQNINKFNRLLYLVDEFVIEKNAKNCMKFLMSEYDVNKTSKNVLVE